MPMNEDPRAPSSSGTPWLLLLVLGLGGYGAWVYLRGLPTGDVTPAATAAAAGGDAAAAAGGDAATTASGNAAAVSTFASTSAGGAQSSPSKGSPQPGGGLRAGRAAPASGGPVARPASTTVPAPGGSQSQPAAADPVPVAVSAEPERGTPPNARPVPAAGASIYDAANTDVKSPALVTPMANAPLRTNVRYSPGVAAIEVIVGGDGAVESVKALTKPATLGEALEYTNGLSIAKTWRFDPAVRDGQPVKYRFFIPLTTIRVFRGVK